MNSDHHRRSIKFELRCIRHKLLTAFISKADFFVCHSDTQSDHLGYKDRGNSLIINAAAKIGLIVVFVYITSPTATHAIARSALRNNMPVWMKGGPK